MTLRVGVTVKEGNKTRVQPFEGVVIGIHRAGVATTVTVRKTLQGFGVERVFPAHSPLCTFEEVRGAGKPVVRRAKLFYLRRLVGKQARLKTRFVSKREGKTRHEIKMDAMRAEDARLQAVAGGGGGPFSGHMERVPCEGQEGRIIGRGGENIRRVESQTGTRIKMNRVDNVAEVYGTPAQCTEAVRMIQEYIHTAPNRGGGGFGGGGFGQQGGYGGGYQQQSFGQQAGYGGGYQQQAGYGQPAYGAPAGGAPLPHGWEEVNPGNGGPVYYWDTVSNTTTYTRPT